MCKHVWGKPNVVVGEVDQIGVFERVEDDVERVALVCPFDVTIFCVEIRCSVLDDRFCWACRAVLYNDRPLVTRWFGALCE